MNGLVPHNHDFAREQCIDAAFQPLDKPTEWDAVIAGADSLDSEALIAELKADEPYDNHSNNALLVFRRQTRIRIALRAKAKLPQYGSNICSQCGTRTADPVLSKSWMVGKCIHCEEQDYLLPGDLMGELFPAYDTPTRSWGLAYRHDPDRDHKVAAIVVSGYKTYLEALIDAKAPVRFAEIFNQQCEEGCGVDARDALSKGALFELNLPIAPDQFRGFLAANMRRVAPEKTEPYSGDIRSVTSEFFKRSH